MLYNLGECHSAGVIHVAYEDRMTTVWAEVRFSIARRTIELYSIVAGVRQLPVWSRNTYSRWFEESIIA